MSRSLCCCACRRLRGEQSKTTPTDSDFYPSETRPTPSALAQKRLFLKRIKPGKLTSAVPFQMVSSPPSRPSLPHSPIGRATSVTCEPAGPGQWTSDNGGSPAVVTPARRSWFATQSIYTFNNSNKKYNATVLYPACPIIKGGNKVRSLKDKLAHNVFHFIYCWMHNCGFNYLQRPKRVSTQLIEFRRTHPIQINKCIARRLW